MADRIVVMRDGLIQQIGTPARGVRAAGEHVRRHLRGQPADEPARRARSSTSEPVPCSRAPSHSPSTARVPEGLPDGPVTLGIRPEHVSLGEPGTPGAIAGTVALVENVGADAYLSVSVAEGDDAVGAHQRPDQRDRGCPGGPSIRSPQHIRWFDAAGHRITQEAS